MQLQTSLFASFVVTLLTYLCKMLMDFVCVWQHSVTKYIALVAALFQFAYICIQHKLNYILNSAFLIYSCQMYLFWLQRNSLKLRQLIQMRQNSRLDNNKVIPPAHYVFLGWVLLINTLLSPAVFMVSLRLPKLHIFFSRSLDLFYCYVHDTFPRSGFTS